MAYEVESDDTYSNSDVAFLRRVIAAVVCEQPLP